jgi:hypothetical protein
VLTDNANLWDIFCRLVFSKILSSASQRRRVKWSYTPHILPYEVDGDDDHLHAGALLHPVKQPPMPFGKVAEWPLDGVFEKP